MIKNKLVSVLCTNVLPDCYQKLKALSLFSGGQELSDIAGMALERGTTECWETYRRNPKHAQQIKKWEEDNEM